MAWDSTKVDGSPSDSTNGRLNAVDWNSIVSYVKGIYSDIATHIATYHIANDDARLSNARTPTSHAHEESDITGLDTSLSGKSDANHTHTDTYEAKNANIQSHISSLHLALGETEETAYQGYKGQIAYHHALEAHAPADANNYVHPAAHAPAIITQDASNRFVTDAEKSTWNGKQAPATTLAGYGITDAEAKNANIQSHISSAHLALGETSATAYAGDKGKTAYDHSQVAHAPSGAEANVQPDWNSATGDSQILNKPDITKPVGVTVYKSGSTYYAIGSSGATISSGTVASTVIQAAVDSFESSGGSVFLSAGSYSILTEISVPVYCHVYLDKAAIILITTNINGFILHNGSVLSGGTIDVTGVSGGYTANAITLDGDNRIRAEWPAGIHDIRINNDTYTGTAIYLKSTSAGSVAAGTSGRIYGTRITNVHINFFEYGIRTYLTGTTENFINGNLFENIWMIFPVHGIHMSSATNGYSSYDYNTFRNINIQPVNYDLPSNDPEYSGLSPTPTVTIKGRYNRFEDLAVWDWEASWGAHTEFTQYTQNNRVEIFDAYGSPNYALYTDAGINNILKFSHFDQDDYPYVRRRLNKVYGNIGVPTVEEMAVCDGQMSNLLRWTVPTTQESSTDGTNYTTSTALSAASLKTLMIGEGQGLSGSSANILTLTAGSTGYHRLTWDAATSDPLYLSKLYLYLSTSNLYATILVEKYSLPSEAWVTVATGTVRNWPGHAYVPHDLILLSTTSSTSYHSKVRVTISATNTGGSTLYIRLYQAAWHGGFPVLSRSAITYDGDKIATFPASVNIPTGATFNINGSPHTHSYEPANANIQSHISSAHAPAGAEANVQPDWNQATNTSDDYIKNKPTLGGAAALSVGTTTGTVCAGDDSRLSDARTPSTHSHAESDVTNLTTDLANISPRVRMFYVPSYLYATNGTEKSILSTSGYHIQNSVANGDYFLIPVWCSGAETILDVSYRQMTSRGIFDLYINDELDSSSHDTYGNDAAVLVSITLSLSVNAGWNTLKLTVNGKNASSSGYALSIYGVRLR